MPRYRLITDPVEVAVYDGDLVGQIDPVFGKVVPGTCPEWFPNPIEEIPTLVGLEVRDGEWVATPEGLFFAEGNAWRKLEIGDRIICCVAGAVTVITAETFLNFYEPA